MLLVGDGGHGLQRSLQRGEEVAQLSLLTVDKVQLMVKLLLLQLDPLQVRVQLHNLMKQGTIKTSTSLSKKKKALGGGNFTFAHTHICTHWDKRPGHRLYTPPTFSPFSMTSLSQALTCVACVRKFLSCSSSSAIHLLVSSSSCL